MIQKYTVDALQLSGFGQLVLLDVDGLGENLVACRLGLHQLEPVEVVQSLATSLLFHALGPGGLCPLLGDFVVLPGLSDNTGSVKGTPNEIQDTTLKLHQPVNDCNTYQLTLLVQSCEVKMIAFFNCSVFSAICLKTNRVSNNKSEEN